MVMNKKEKYLMNGIYAAASQKTGQCLIAPFELLARIPYTVKFKENDLEPTMEALSLDGYFEYELANKKGDSVYLITLKEKGMAYEREKKNDRKKIYKRIVTTILFAVLGYVVKVIISAILGR
jgi:hypothetical protein